jgi:hypothetical protein
MYDEYKEKWDEEEEIPEELREEYIYILKERDAIERELSLFVLAGALGAFWYLWND